MKAQKAAIAAFAIALGASASAPVWAKIHCSEDGYQRVGGSWLSTPYCQDNLVAKVAREYGMRVSDAEVRNNPNRKGDVCRFIGSDNRVRHACQGYDNSDRQGR
jgi:hypothetical protein